MNSSNKIVLDLGKNIQNNNIFFENKLNKPEFKKFKHYLFLFI